ncbi:verprolin-like [Triticum dicoccoides]|uniref:verprolin-like n=1 Tax=Triticum dicoccoides TaxID=85692 RepID=UPI00188E9F72|nr:verprolin-like [Triticum dicoccoides]
MAPIPKGADAEALEARRLQLLENAGRLASMRLVSDAYRCEMDWAVGGKPTPEGPSRLGTVRQHGVTIASMFGAEHPVHATPAENIQATQAVTDELDKYDGDECRHMTERVQQLLDAAAMQHKAACRAEKQKHTHTLLPGLPPSAPSASLHAASAVSPPRRSPPPQRAGRLPPRRAGRHPSRRLPPPRHRSPPSTLVSLSSLHPSAAVRPPSTPASAASLHPSSVILPPPQRRPPPSTAQWPTEVRTLPRPPAPTPRHDPTPLDPIRRAPNLTGPRATIRRTTTAPLLSPAATPRPRAPLWDPVVYPTSSTAGILSLISSMSNSCVRWKFHMGDTRFKCSSPIRDVATKENLWEALLDGGNGSAELEKEKEESRPKN